MIKLLIALLLFSCQSRNTYFGEFRQVKEEAWKITPKQIKFNQRSKFLIYGENLDSGYIYVDPSVKYDAYTVTDDGKCIITYLTVNALKMHSKDKLGERTIEVSVPQEDEFKVFTIKVIGDIEEK